MQNKKFGKLDFKKFHPAGSLGLKLKTVEDLMLIKNKIPFINENSSLGKAFKILNEKKLGVIIVIDNKKTTKGIFTDGDLKRLVNKKKNFDDFKIKKFMTKKPFSVNKDILAAKALNIMNEKKITCLCVYGNKKKNKTIGIIHIHNILNSNIS